VTSKEIASCALLCLLFSSSIAAPPPSPANPPSTLNDNELPGVIARSIKQEQLTSVPDGQGFQFIVEKTTRAAQTRTPLHKHEHGGKTCVLEGEMTLYMEGAQPQRAIAGDCYDMPAGLVMAGINTGDKNAVMYDIFTIPVGQPVWKVVEPGALEFQNQFTHEH